MSAVLFAFLTMGNIVVATHLTIISHRDQSTYTKALAFVWWAAATYWLVKAVTA